MPDYMPGYRLHAMAARCGQFDGSEALQALRDSLAYLPPPEKPQMKALRGNPLPLRSWAILVAVTVAFGAFLAWVL